MFVAGGGRGAVAGVRVRGGVPDGGVCAGGAGADGQRVCHGMEPGQHTGDGQRVCAREGGHGSGIPVAVCVSGPGGA